MTWSDSRTRCSVLPAWQQQLHLRAAHLTAPSLLLSFLLLLLLRLLLSLLLLLLCQTLQM